MVQFSKSLIAALCVLAISFKLVVTQGDDFVVLSPRDYLSATGFRSRTLPAKKGDHCVFFYTKLDGKGFSMLHANLEEAETGNAIHGGEIFQRVDEGEASLTYFYIREQSKPFQVVIKKMEGDSYGPIEILDVEVKPGKCLVSDASCNFESKECTENYELIDKRWLLVSPGESSRDTEGYPSVDGDQHQGSGHYLKTKVTKGQQKTAQFVLPVIKTQFACIRFYYTISGAGELVIGKRESDKVYATFNSPDPTSIESHPKWKEGQVDIKEEDHSFQVTFTAYAPGSKKDSKMAVDDVRVTPRSCFYLPLKPPPNEIPIIEEASCTFDNNCTSLWTPLKLSNGWTWRAEKGEDRKNPPLYDHTKGNGEGYFMYSYVWQQKKIGITPTVLRGPDFDRRHSQTGDSCFSFWYFMHSSRTPRLAVNYRRENSVDDETYSLLDALWARTGDQGPGWHQAFVHIPYPGKDTKAHIEFVVMNTVTGRVAIDDVVVYDGPCPNIGTVCDFEDLEDMCGFETESGEWKRDHAIAAGLSSKTGLLIDRSTQTALGSYMYIAERASTNSRPWFKSPVYPPTAGRCLKFYYNVKPANSQPSIALDIFIETESGDRFLIDELSGAGRQGKWSLAEINVFFKTNFQIIFAARPDGGVISLDDIQLSTSACADSYGCDFEQGMCAWSPSLDDLENPNWQVTSGHLVGDRMLPERDVTQNTPFGQYIYLATEEESEPGEIAVLTSQELAYGSCLTFYYSMISSSVGSLSVNVTNLADGSQPDTVWSRSGSQGKDPQWKKAEVNLNVAPIDGSSLMNYQISFIGTVGTLPGADIAIDEVKVHFERCANVQDSEDLMVFCPKSKSDQKIQRSQLCNFIVDCDDGGDEQNCGDCDFGEDMGWCNYVDSSQGDIMWASSMDATDLQLEGIPKRPGHYIYLARNIQDNPGPLILADLETSIPLGPSPPSCQLQFSYFVSDSDSDELPLQVVLRQSDEETTLFREESLSGGTKWRPVEIEPVWTTVTIDIGGIDSRFKIVFLGHKTFGLETEGQVAIADIKLENCQFPPIEATCLDSQFQCTRGSCVDLSRVCDFTDDCGDQSDETYCESHGVTLKTSFEDGFGEWTEGPDSSSTTWTLVQARDVQDKPAHPTRDHTLGTLNGHFASAAQRSDQDPAQIISPVLVPTNDIDSCHLRLHYYLHATDENSHLRVSTKTTQQGEEKVLLHRYTSHGDAWTRVDIEIPNTGEPFQVIISGKSETWRRGNYLAIDDISLMGCNISSGELPLGSTVASPDSCGNSMSHRCDDGTCLAIGQVMICDFINQCPDGSDEKDCGTCDFETGQCGWHDESLGTFSWVSRGSGQEREPSSDATIDTEGEGHYMMLKTTSAGVDKSPALLLSPVLYETDPSCELAFYYYTNQNSSARALKVVTQNMHTAGTESYLDVSLDKGVRIVPGQWNRIEAKLGISTGQRRVIIKHDYLELDDSAAIAIDDVKFQNCQRKAGMKNMYDAEDPLACDFHDTADFCNYHPSYMAGNYHWSKGFVADVNGNYIGAAMAGAWDGSEVGHVALLTSDYINGTDTGLCLQFMYMTFGTSLQVSLVEDHGKYRVNTRTIFSHHSYDYTWKIGRASIPRMENPFLVDFVATVQDHAKAVYILFIKVSHQECFPTRMCDFFNDECGFTTEDKYGWFRQRPEAGRFLEDHTTGDLNGFYMLTIGHNSQRTDRLTSATKTKAPDQGSCTYFWYSIHGQDAGSLTVKLKQEGSNRTSKLWQASGQSSNHWLQGRVDIPKDVEEYKLVFEAALNGQEWISLDDIETIPGACPNPGTCNFDVDMCGYTSHTYNGDNREVDTEARWIRLVSGMPMTAYSPHKDHTERQHNGGFAFSDQFIRLFLNTEETTRLSSPILPPTEHACLSFWFFFNGRGRGTLSVKVADTTVFEISSKDDKWRYSSDIEHSSVEPYQITFESKRIGHEEAAMAIDDIVVTQGDCAQPHIPLLPSKPKATTTPEPIVTAKQPESGSGSAADHRILGCGGHCVHWRSCRVLKTGSVECECEQGYKGERCNQVSFTDDTRPVDIAARTTKRPLQEKPDASFTKDRAKPTEEGKSPSSMLTVIIAVIVTAIVLIAIGLIVFIILVRTNRLRAPASIQRMVPYLKTEEGFQNPYNKFTTPDNDVAIPNPVYIDNTVEESGI